MFDNLSSQFTRIFDRLKRKGLLTIEDVESALREIRIALLEADVALPVVKEFAERVKEKAIGAEIIKAISPAQLVIKIVHDELIHMLGEKSAELTLTSIPSVILMVGLQGSGKTTTTGKLALRLQQKRNKKILMASLDIYRPAAQQQLQIIGEKNSIATLPIIAGEKPEAIAERAMLETRKGGFDVLLLDTAGRLHIDHELMAELKTIKDITRPHETVLVVDAMTGQDAVNSARAFHEAVSVTGLILTRMDGDARGGAALSIRAVTGCPILALGTGETSDALEEFHPERVASRILDMGDVVSLVEKAMESIEEEDAKEMEKKLKKGTFDLNDLAKQLKTMRKMGGMSSLMGLLPGIGKIKSALQNSDMDEKRLIRLESIIYSMTPRERRNPDLLNASRKRRIAKGSGVEVMHVNQLLKQHRQMAEMIKRLSKMNEKSFMRGGGIKGLFGG